jgi:D-lactate dehydrogenase
MCCGVEHNAFHTLKNIQFVLTDGTLFDTRIEADYQKFASHPIGKGIASLKKEFDQNQTLVQKVLQKYMTKNTVGYSLNAFTVYQHPLDIFAHLLIGAEGTLAYIAEAELSTIPDLPYKSTAMLYFDDIAKACDAIPTLININCKAIELMDYASLMAIKDLEGAPTLLQNINTGACALLVELQESSKETLDKTEKKALSTLQQLPLLTEIFFTQDPKEQYKLWKLRKGLFPAVGAIRARGTTVILEDLAFPVRQLADAIKDCQRLFQKYHYHNAIIFGHAKDGNIHFVITQSFQKQEDVERYDAFMKEIVDLVVAKYNGALKAEHGTGRNMAPFVETEWGGDAYQFMLKIKTLCDPKNILNPGVIINKNPKAHLENIKQMPQVEDVVDKCIECGYCEAKCPSKDLTLSPRRRIVARRELQLLKNDSTSYNTLLQQYQFSGLDTCAVDGLCASECPVDINTGELVKQLRAENHNKIQNKVANWVASNFATVQNGIKIILTLGNVFAKVIGHNTLTKTTHCLQKLNKNIPVWNYKFYINTHPYKLKNEKVDKEKPMLVYFPSCINRVFNSHEHGDKSLTETFVDVAHKAGYQVIVPNEIDNLCCGQPFSSKGFVGAYNIMANNTLKILAEYSKSHNNAIVVSDLSSCSYTLISYLRSQSGLKLEILDIVDFLADHTLPKLKIKQTNKSITLHPACSLTKMHTQQKFLKIATQISTQVHIPIHAGCCGMAGDRGFLVPSLPESATEQESNEVNMINAESHYCTSTTCELALSKASNKTYKSILYLVNECS